MRRRSDLSNLNETLSQVMKQYHLDKRTKQELAASNWAEVVGERNAAASRPDVIRDGILFVSCKSAAWAQELTFLKHRIINEINKRAGGDIITDIRFAGSGLKKPAEQVGLKEEEWPSPNEIQEIKLGKDELESISKALKGIEDPALIQKMRTAMESAHRFDHWKLAHGWSKCGRCGDIFKGNGKTCGSCGTE